MYCKLLSLCCDLWVKHGVCTWQGPTWAGLCGQIEGFDRFQTKAIATSWPTATYERFMASLSLSLCIWLSITSRDSCIHPRALSLSLQLHCSVCNGWPGKGLGTKAWLLRYENNMRCDCFNYCWRYVLYKLMACPIFLVELAYKYFSACVLAEDPRLRSGHTFRLFSITLDLMHAYN